MPSSKRLNVRSDKAYETASRLAKRAGRSRTDVVLAALLDYEEALGMRRLTTEERAFVDELIAAARQSPPSPERTRS